VKACAIAAGYIAAGPMRPPYHDLPKDWADGAEARGKAWAKLREQFPTRSA
jgi:trans-o-hydroxybenzylidenepyruvate hydratase-aldolase